MKKLTAVVALVVLNFNAIAGSPSNELVYSPNVDIHASTQVYWGDTHLHSSLSSDAFGFGNRLGPDAAFRFASGQEVANSHQQRAKLRRPLDFVVLADHSESLGMMALVYQGDKRIIEKDPILKKWHQLATGTVAQRAEFSEIFKSRVARLDLIERLTVMETPKLKQSNWQATLTVADQYNNPGKFTTLLGYEFSPSPDGSMLHRVVIFRDGVDKVGKLLPYSSLISEKPVDLWKHLAKYEDQTGGRVLAIPHNGNLSNGLMFPAETAFGGVAVDKNYAEQRRRWEPLYEVTQIKGDGEAHPLLSPDDEFADFDTWDWGNMLNRPKTDAMLPGEYARSGLLRGLQLKQKLAVNPYQFGMIGSTDSHTSLSAVEEDNFYGKHSAGTNPGPERWKHAVGTAGKRKINGSMMASAGYAGVWATENTRTALWDAMMRREVYATTGPRISVRFFGGWDFDADDANTPDFAQTGYRKGVPMGGNLTAAKQAKAPTFLVAALKDSIGANLDRVQIVKGWVNAKGEPEEKVFNVSWSEPDQRKLNSKGQLPAVGNTVDVKNASWTNNIGAVQLTSVWQDPDFDSQQAAFYYARVIEIPTPRWTAYDAKRYRISMDKGVAMITQERAYTSPIWYTPQ